MSTKLKKKTNWQKGLVTTFAIAAFTATVTNYAVWNEDILTDYTYTDDNVAVDDNLFVGTTITSGVNPATTLNSESIFTIYNGLAEMDFIDSTNTGDPSWSIGQVANTGAFNVTWRGDMDTTDGGTVVTQHVMNLEENSPANSIETFATGDVSLAAGDVFWDTSSNFLGLGTSVPEDSLHLTGVANIKLDWAGTSEWQIGSLIGGGIWFRDQLNNTIPFRINGNVPTNSFYMTDAGIGMGTSVPDAALEVERSDGSARILVEENSGVTAKRVLAKLENNGAPSMLFTNSNSGEQWELNPNGVDHFIISNLGTGGAEVLITKGTGNMTVRGTVTAQGAVLTSSRETKEEFKPVDNAEILDKVASLPITEWKFKADQGQGPSHIGPMAEDFEEAFQLGTDGKTIGVTDMNGITLASIQALNDKLVEKNKQLEELQKRLIQLEEAIK